MPKPNTYIQLMQAKQDIVKLLQEIDHLRHDGDIIKGFTVQQSLDMAIIALHNEFHFGPKMVRRFEDAFLETFKDYARMCISDSADDEEIVYTKEKVDQALRAACGDNIRPFDERYALENLYFRDKLMKEEKSED